MQIVIYNSASVPAALAGVLAADGHRVRTFEEREAVPSADLFVLDATDWPAGELERIVGAAPTAELILLVDSLDQPLPSEAAMALLKPVELTKLVRLVRLVDEARSGRSDPRDLVDFDTLFAGDSPEIVELLRRVRLLAQSDAPVWLHGELGTGRAVVARAIHDHSARRSKRFLAVNAAAYPGDLLEEHLFSGREPLIATAGGGTLFVDSVTELAPGVQSKLLRLLEVGMLRAGGHDRALDVRVMVADERRTLNVGGRLRRELHQHLRVHELDLPALRERSDDLGAIIARMLERLRTDGKLPPLTTAAARSLASYAFPGNIRELAHALTHAVVLAQGGPIDLGHLPVDIQGNEVDAARFEDLETVAKRFERDYLLRVLRAVGGNRSRAARILNLSRKGLWQKLKAHGVAFDEGREDEA